MPVLVRRDWRGGNGYHNASATTFKTGRNPASGGPKSTAGRRCVPPMMPRITLGHAPCRQTNLGHPMGQ